jgi:hypothetical protein
MYGTFRGGGIPNVEDRDVNADAAQAWFIAGTVPLILAGGLHAFGAVLETVRPTFFTPTEGSVRPALEGSGISLRRMLPGGGSGESPSMWSVWLGINIGFGLATFSFGLLCLLIAADDFDVVERIDAVRLLTIAFAAAALAISLRYWWYAQVVITGGATACFTVAALLLA